jgi:uncharacterized protein YegP (UPF0339 family)
MPDEQSPEDITDLSEDSGIQFFGKGIKDIGKQFVLFWDFSTGATLYSWRLRGAHGETLAFSPRRYTTKRDCQSAIEFAQTGHPDVPVVDLTRPS